MKKNGFTLIEIIISIGLIMLIGTSSVLIYSNNNKTIIKNLDLMSDEIYTAVQLLVETNTEVKKQLYNNKNGVVIPLKKLQNEGILDFGDINIENQHVLTMLASNTEEDKCNGSLYNIGTWTISDDDIIYICTDRVEDSSSSIKQNLIDQSTIYFAKGENPNNYVFFDVNTDESAPVYFPSEDQDLWRILSIDESDNIKLVYNKVVATDNSKLYNTSSSAKYEGDTYYEFLSTYSSFKDDYNSILSKTNLKYFYYTSTTGWSNIEVISGDNQLKKKYLFNNIVNQNWLANYNWKNFYLADGYSLEVGISDNKYEGKLGTINSDELLSTLSGGNTWLPLNIVFGLEGNLFSASSDVAYAAGFAGISLGGGSKISSFLSIGYTYMSSYDFLPAVVLDKKVKLVNNTSCASGAILGSKECPYKLECSSCA